MEWELLLIPEQGSLLQSQNKTPNDFTFENIHPPNSNCKGAWLRIVNNMFDVHIYRNNSFPKNDSSFRVISNGYPGPLF